MSTSQSAPIVASAHRMTGRAARRVAVIASVVAVAGLLGTPGTAAAESRPGPSRPWSDATASSTAGTASVPAVTTAPDASIVQAAEQGVADAAARGVQQSVAVIDRSSGTLVADVGGTEVYNTESLTKLFTAAYYLEQARGAPSTSLTAQLSTMIEVSDDDIQSSLWRSGIVPGVVGRYGLTGTSNPADASDGNWGSDRTTADDMVVFLLRASQDPWVGSSVLSWMASAQPTGADGFDQSFGLFALTGDRGVKQGWSDADWQPRNLHSVGWTDRYFIAILQTSPSASFDTLRSTSTATAELLAGPAGPAATTSSAASDPAITSSTASSTPSSAAPTEESADGADAATLGTFADSLTQAVRTALLEPLLG